MIVGVDFDNTMVCYDQVFQQAAVERGLVPPQTAPSKTAVRDWLRAADAEARWTELQGLVYGRYIRQAPAFTGLREFLQGCAERNTTVYVISHKTRQPLAGPPADLHAAARNWLSEQRLLGARAVESERVFFEETKREKLARIAACGCDWFVDDLPEFLAEPDFPDGVRKILFDPLGIRADVADVRRATSWFEIGEILFGRQHDA